MLRIFDNFLAYQEIKKNKKFPISKIIPAQLVCYRDIEADAAKSRIEDTFLMFLSAKMRKKCDKCVHFIISVNDVYLSY